MRRIRRWLFVVVVFSLLAGTVHAQDTAQACDLNSPAEFNTRGNEKLANRDYEGALADYDCALQLDPNYLTAIINRGNVFRSLGQYDQAIAEYNIALERDPNNQRAYYRRGFAYFSMGDMQNALADYNRSIELEPVNPDAFNERGRVHLELEQYQSAIDDFTQSLQLGYRDPYISYYNRGTAYLRMRDYAKAEEDLNLALSVNPDYAVAYNNRGNIYYAQGDYQRAIEDYDRAIALRGDQENHLPYFNRGLAYSNLGDYAQAVADFAESIRIEPAYIRAYLNRGDAYQALDNPAALADYEEWVQRNRQRTLSNPISGPIDAVPLDLNAGMVYEIPFAAQAGQSLSIAARTQGSSRLDPLIVLLDASGRPVAADNDGGVNLDAIIPQFAVPQDANYTLLVTHGDGGSSGRLELTLTFDGEALPVFTIYALAVGEQATVFTTGNTVLNVRGGPGLDFPVVARLEPRTNVTLLEGPRKEDGYAWWRIRTADGQEGWSVERVDEEQTLQPALVIGGAAKINTENDTLNVRADAGLSFDIVTQLPSGTLVTVIDGPKAGDDLIWWKIRTPNGEEGWVVERVQRQHTLIGQPNRTGS